MNWFDAIDHYVQIVELGSFSAVAKKRYRTVSSVTKKIDWLEDQLECQLLQRSTRKLMVTEKGQKFYQSAKFWLENFHEITTSLREEKLEAEGELRITAPIPFGENCLAPIISDFMQLYPKISVDLHLSNHYEDLIESGYDLAIRARETTEARYQSLPLINSQLGVFASKKYLSKFGKPESLEDLSTHHCLCHKDFFNPLVWKFKNNKSVTVKPKLSSNNLQTLINASVADQGIIYISQYLITTKIDSGELEPILQKFWPAQTPIQLIYPKQQFLPMKITAFIDFVQNAFLELF